MSESLNTSATTNDDQFYCHLHHGEEEHEHDDEGVINFCEIMSNTKLSDINDQNCKQTMCLYYFLNKDQDVSDGEFKIMKFNNQLNLTIEQIVHPQNLASTAMFLINICGINHLYYFKYCIADDDENSHIEHEFNSSNEVFINEHLKLVPFPFRKNEFVTKFDKSGTLMKTNLNSIWDSEGSIISVNNNTLEHSYLMVNDQSNIKYIENFNDEIIHFERNGHRIFLTKSGKIYGYGENLYNQLNLNGGNDNFIQFISDISFDSLSFKKVIPGLFKTHFITENGKLYASGENSDYNLGCSEGKTRQEIHNDISIDNGKFQSNPARKCDIIDEKYEIEHVYQIGINGLSIFLTREKKLLACGKYFDENGNQVISIGDIYPLDGEIDQLFICANKYLLVITKNGKVHVIGKRNIDPKNYNKKSTRILEDRFIERVKTQIETLISLDERIFGKLEIYPNPFDMGCVLKLEMSLDLIIFFKSLRSQSLQSKTGFSDLTFNFC
ncbi:predicted protein [Naegleria gruberi]|uniref:Predicted protein n=1 Tax=Naegleria gruberi TaxID=5762 RepID=D2VYK4_NAEGR|nr:uncharacterized protein NAEGRDRAFT_74152 [Naegleria gruberi]EFC38072.1 predicted protein [Naegleria gruberi]|eukprot:XP_002670816.1 predicted protein [Naegleria gruberi strain NEG-M]